jgi:hypothetical protein
MESLSVNEFKKHQPLISITTRSALNRYKYNICIQVFVDNQLQISRIS